MNCYILTGGASSRMGTSKVEIELGGRTFFERVLASCEGAFEEVLVVTKPNHGAFPVPVIHERNEELTAPIVGLECVLDHARNEPVWVVGVDYPFLTADLLCFLRARFEESGAEITVPEVRRKLHMLCAGYRPTIAGTVKEKIARGDLAMKGLVSAHRTQIIAGDEIAAHFGIHALMNVNTPDDLEEARRIHAEIEGT